MTNQKKTAERWGAHGGQGSARNTLNSQYSTLSAFDALLMMTSFTLGYIAGVLL